MSPHVPVRTTKSSRPNETQHIDQHSVYFYRTPDKATYIGRNASLHTHTLARHPLRDSEDDVVSSVQFETYKRHKWPRRMCYPHHAQYNTQKKLKPIWIRGEIAAAGRTMVQYSIHKPCTAVQHTAQRQNRHVKTRGRERLEANQPRINGNVSLARPSAWTKQHTIAKTNKQTKHSGHLLGVNWPPTQRPQNVVHQCTMTIH